MSTSENHIVFAPPRNNSPDYTRPTSRAAFIAQLARPIRRVGAAAAAASVVVDLGAVCAFWIVGKALDEAVASRQTPSLTWTALALALAVVIVATHIWAGNRNENAVTISFNSMRGHGYHLVSKHLLAVGAALTRHKSSGEAVSTVVKDGLSLGMYCIVFVQFLPQILTRVIGTAVLAWFTSWRVGITIFTSCVIAIVVAGLVSLVISKPVRAYREADAQLTSVGTDAMSGMRTLRGLGATNVLEDRYQEVSAEVEKRERAVALAESLVSAVALIAAGGLIVAVSGHALYEFGAQRLTIGSVVALVGLAVALSPALSLTAAATSAYRSSRVAQQRLMSLFRLPAVNTKPSSATANGGPNVPAADFSRFETITDLQANLTTQRGAFHVVTSRDMAAVTACAERLAAVPFKAPSGAVAWAVDHSLAGADTFRAPVALTDLPLEVVRQHIVFCDPRPQLFAGTLRSQIDPWGQATDDDVVAAMHVAAVEEILTLMPAGLAEPVTEQGRSLSGGQQQRICLARAILRDPDVLVLLEPASAVDAPTSMLIAERLAAARTGRTTIVFSNSPFFAQVADVVSSLDSQRPSATHETLGSDETLGPGRKLDAEETRQDNTDV